MRTLLIGKGAVAQVPSGDRQAELRARQILTEPFRLADGTDIHRQRAIAVPDES